MTIANISEVLIWAELQSILTTTLFVNTVITLSTVSLFTTHNSPMSGLGLQALEGESTEQGFLCVVPRCPPSTQQSRARFRGAGTRRGCWTGARWASALTPRQPANCWVFGVTEIH